MASSLTTAQFCMLLFSCSVCFLPMVLVGASSPQCPAGTPLARSRGYWGNSGQGGGSNHCPSDSCDLCTKNDPSYATLLALCEKPTMKACVGDGNNCWTQLAALLLDAKGCNPAHAQVQVSALYSTNRLIKASDKCSYLPASSTITLSGLFAASFAKAQTVDGCNPVKDCLGKVLGTLDSNTARDLLACENPGTGGSNDPIFMGFNNVRYEFHGKSGHVYTLLSEQDLLLNAGMIGVGDIEARRAGQHETYMGAIAFRNHHDKVLVTAVHGDKLSVIVNRVVMALADLDTSALNSLPDGTTVKLWSRGREVSDTVQVVTPKLTFTITATGHHLDFTIDRISNGLCGVHGVLGQTYTPNGAVSAAPAAGPQDQPFKVAGQESDYHVARLFAHNSKFNTYGVEPANCGSQGGGSKSDVDVKGNKVGSVAAARR